MPNKEDLLTEESSAAIVAHAKLRGWDGHYMTSRGESFFEFMNHDTHANFTCEWAEEADDDGNRTEFRHFSLQGDPNRERRGARTLKSALVLLDWRMGIVSRV